jgi:hypothetical protein
MEETSNMSNKGYIPDLRGYLSISQSPLWGYTSIALYSVIGYTLYMSDDAKVWDLFNGDKTPEEISISRLEICKSCEWFRPKIQTCKKCGCFMKLKTTLEKAKCPIGKW